MGLSVVNKVVPIGAIQPHPDNYNIHPDRQILELGESHDEFGQYRSVVVWERPDGQFIQVAGHGIVEAMKRNGVQEVRADVLPPDTSALTVKRILLADNLHAQNSISNDVALARLLEEQKNSNMGLTALGTSDNSLQALLARVGNEHFESFSTSYVKDRNGGYEGGGYEDDGDEDDGDEYQKPVTFKEFDETIEDDMDTELCQQCGKLCLKAGRGKE